MNFTEAQEQRFQEVQTKYKFRREDFSLFKPKKYYSDPINELELQKELDQLDNYLGEYNHNKEIPKLSNQFLGASRQIDYLQNGVFLSALTAFIAGKILAIERYGDFVNENRVRITRFKLFGLIMIPTSLFMYTNQIFQPQNRGINAQLPYEVRLKNELDLKMNLYQNVEQIINKDEYPTWSEYRLASNRAMNRELQSKIKTNEQ